MDEIITGRHLAETNGFNSFREWVKTQAAEKFRKNMLAKPFLGTVVEGRDLHARINFGRWIVDCPDCNGAEYIDPEDKFFFCLSCGNASLGGAGRRVILPKNKDAIEVEVLKRPMMEHEAGNQIAKTMHAQPVYPGLSRSWDPGETLTDLRAQYKFCKALAKATSGPDPLPTTPPAAPSQPPPISSKLEEGKEMEGGKTKESGEEEEVKNGD